MPKLPTVRTTPDKFKCMNCGRVVDIPLCCGEEMVLEKGMLACAYCGRTREIPTCCGGKMAFVPVA
ncbi:MAG: hypothetical protein QXH27_05860 [Candidatus Micrarchaeia archaeon]